MKIMDPDIEFLNKLIIDSVEAEIKNSEYLNNYEKLSRFRKDKVCLELFDQSLYQGSNGFHNVKSKF